MGKLHTEIEHRHCDVPAAASRTVIVGMVVNGILILLKFAAGIAGRSSAMVADAVHSLSDFLTDIVVLVSLKISRRPPDQSHDYGHEKFETLATAIVGVVVFFAGAKILYSAGKKIFALIASGESSLFPGPTGVALAAAVISIGLKEGIFRYTIAVGRRIGSSALVANAWHHRSDALSSVAALVGIGGAMILGPRWAVLDPIAALVVSAFIIRASYKIIAPSIGELMEQSLDENTEREILRIIEGVEGVRNPHNLRTRKIGNKIAIDVHIRVPPDMTVLEAHRINDRIEIRLRQRFGENTIINIHTEPEI